MQSIVGRQTAGDLYEPGSDRHFPLLVRLAPKYRENMDALRRIAIGTPGPNGGIVQVPLSEVATVGLSSGAFYIYREQQERYIPVKFSVRGRDLGGAVLKAQQKVAELVKLPPGYRLSWAGDFVNFESAIGLILLLLCLSFGSFTDTLLVGSGILVLSCYNRLVAGGLERDRALAQTCEPQIRPLLMTCTAARVDLLSAGFSTPSASSRAAAPNSPRRNPRRQPRTDHPRGVPAPGDLFL